MGSEGGFPTRDFMVRTAHFVWERLTTIRWLRGQNIVKNRRPRKRKKKRLSEVRKETSYITKV